MDTTLKGWSRKASSGGDDLPAEHKKMRNSQEKNQGKVFQSKGSDYTKKAKPFEGQNGQFYWDGMIINFIY